MPLVKDGQIVEDRYVRVADDAPLAGPRAGPRAGRALPGRRRTR